MIWPFLINLHPNECSQKLHYYPFTVKLDRSVGSCNTLNNLSNKLCVPYKTEDLNLSMFNMIKGINEWKTLTKHISCEYKCKFDGIKWNSNQSGIMINVDVNVKNSIREKDHIWNPTTCSCKNFYILLAFLSITIALMIAVSIYCYLIKYQAKQKHMLPFHVANNELKEIMY